MAMDAGQLPVSVGTVKTLVEAQFPQWRELPVTRVASPGTVNAVFRIGGTLAARFPLQEQDPGDVRRALESEAAAARELAAATRFPVPETVALGEPGSGYPLPWSVQTWLFGVRAGAQPVGPRPVRRRVVGNAVVLAVGGDQGGSVRLPASRFGSNWGSIVVASGVAS